MRTQSWNMPSRWAERTCPYYVELTQVARRRLAQSVLGFILRMLREWRKAENCLNHCSAKLTKNPEWYLGGGSWFGTEHGLSHYWLPQLVSPVVAFHPFLLSPHSLDALCPLPSRFGLFLATLFFFFPKWIFLLPCPCLFCLCVFVIQTWKEKDSRQLASWMECNHWAHLWFWAPPLANQEIIAFRTDWSNQL